MKILYFNDFRLGVFKGDNSVVDVTAVVQDIPHTGPGDLINGLIERFSSYRQKLEQAVAQGQGVPLASVRIRPPLPKPTTIDCMAVNYMNNGTLMQNFNTDDMGHKIPRCIEWLTSIHTLEPGDIIATGTNHRGLNPFMDGDKIEIETEGLGRLTFNIKDELKRKWERKTRLQMHEAAKEKTAGNYPDITPQAEGKYAKTA